MVQLYKNFYPRARELRSHFEKRFADPRSTRDDRFIWDYWHVPGQYTALRTPPYHFFPAKTYEAFHRHLVEWGRETLGCHDISPPWMSAYVEGCRQEMHADVPHGPWAYVFSLTPWKTRKFKGGETVLLKDDVLDYWRNMKTGRDLERDQIFASVPAEFNQLTIFDPRIPHGVNAVSGVHDLKEARLVIHGWFVNPRPFIKGPLKERHLQEMILEYSGRLSQFFEQTGPAHGTLSIRFKVDRSGKTSDFQVLSNSVRFTQLDKNSSLGAVKALVGGLKAWDFKRQAGSSTVTLPLNFEI